MISTQNEYVPLNQAIQIQGEVEDWLKILENVMRETLDKILKDSLAQQNLDITNMPS
jgi:hypothetical protein